MNTIMGTGRFQKAYKRVCRKWGKGRKRVASLFLCAALTASLIGWGFQEAEDAGAKPNKFKTNQNRQKVYLIKKLI